MEQGLASFDVFPDFSHIAHELIVQVPSRATPPRIGDVDAREKILKLSDLEA